MSNLDTALCERDQLLSLLEEVKNACLFVDDDGSVGVSEEAVVSTDLFNRICGALKTIKGGRE